jgi:hypothetical protein
VTSILYVGRVKTGSPDSTRAKVLEFSPLMFSLKDFVLEQADILENFF